MEIPKKTKDEIWDYCRLNDIPNIDDFMLKLINQGFTIEKYGATPVTQSKIIEKKVEVPIEVIVEKIVEKIVEVPIKIDDSELAEKYKDLLKKNDKLKSENDDLKIEIALEKKKNKKDIYGE